MSQPSARPDPLSGYNAKRDFRHTPEPAGGAARGRRRRKAALAFVIQKHWASHLHYDFRLELDDVLLSWAVPKGPCFDPKVRRMAVRVEDHPTSYGDFEGTIPEGRYGAGQVIVWDQGHWDPVGDPHQGLQQGKLVFSLHGQKLAGAWELVRTSKPGARQEQWLLFKKRDAWAQPLAAYDVITALPDSVVERPLGLLEERAGHLGDGGAAQASTSGGDDMPATPDLSAAVKARLPPRLKPQLASLATTPPAGTGWLAETKFDGYRVMARLVRGKARLVTRGGHDWTHKMATLAAEVEGLGVASGWLDGEITVLNEHGLPDFNALQNAIDGKEKGRIVYFLFDAPFLDGLDMRQVPLWSRRAALQQRLSGYTGERVRFSPAFQAPPDQLLAAACRLQMEGLMLKHIDAPYTSARTDTWLKLKCVLRQEFVVCGFTDRQGARGEVGALMLGYHENGALRFAGHVGTGWDARMARDLHTRLVRLETPQPTLDAADVKPGRWSRRAAGAERWVRPELIAEVAFLQWTPDGRVRHASFKGLRTDKPASAITREQAVPPVGTDPPRTGKADARAPEVKVTHPDRVVDPSTGATKLHLVRYYESVATWMLPHLKDRPVALVRAPAGVQGHQFFQKHREKGMPGLRTLDASLWPGHAPLLAVDDAPALRWAAQMNVIEFHTWNATARRIQRPDRIVFDLDPGEGVSWEQVQEAALLTRAMLRELQLEAWLKTSGGKGLHVVVPVTPRRGYEAIKGFAQAVVQHMTKAVPQRFVAKAGAGNRVGRVFVDYLRNGHGQTTVAAYSARARPGLGVSMPVEWDQLMSLKSGAHWTILTAREYLSFRREDPWTGYWTSRQTPTEGMKVLGYKPPATGRSPAAKS